MRKKTTKKKKKNNKLFLIILIIIQIPLTVALLLGVFGRFINPLNWYFPAFFSLFYPFLLLANVFMLVFWLIFKRSWFWIPLLPIILGIDLIPRYFQYTFKKIPNPNSKILTVMSFNTRIFNHAYARKHYRHLDTLFIYTKKINPDIVCFQEYYNDLKKKPQIDEYISKNLGLKYYDKHIHFMRWNHEYGMAIFSRYPILHSGIIYNINYSIKQQTPNFAIYSDVKIGEDTIRVYNVHLESNRLSGEDVFFSIENKKIIEEDIELEKIQYRVKTVFRKLKRALIYRINQVKTIKSHIDNSPYPVIVCGDFNDVAASWVYRFMSKNLKDSFVQAGKGIGATYHTIYPLLRIDYILHDKHKLQSIEHNVLKIKAYISDHRPVYSKMIIR